VSVYLTVIVSSKQRGIGNGLTYSYSGDLNVQMGCIVRVPLRGTIVEGIVIEITKEKPSANFDIREVVEAVSDKAVLNKCHIEIAKWISDYYVCNLRYALSPFLPGKLWSKFIPIESEEDKKDLILDDSNNLNVVQNAACKSILISKKPSYIFSADRIEIYKSLILDAIKSDKSVLLIFPELSGVENSFNEFKKIVNEDNISVIHGKITPACRRKQWQKCISGQTKLVLGTRSALFAPVNDAGLVIIDDEHEWTYKNEQTPRYNTVKVAEHMCDLDRDLKLILGSSSPSIDSWCKIKENKYGLIEMKDNNLNNIENVKVVDMMQIDFGEYYPLSPALVHAIKNRIERKEKSVLLLNKKGFATSLMCKDCRFRFEEKDTGLPYTVHKSGSKSYMRSNKTGERIEIPAGCTNCGSIDLREIGAGTQKIETLLKNIFPSAKVFRIDSDTVSSGKKFKEAFKKINDDDIDIIVGTQSVIRMLSIPDVTLASVVIADVGLSLPHFRAGERVFQLLTQIISKLENKKESEVIIQSFNPETFEIQMASMRKVKEYLEEELKCRRSSSYPPDSQMISFMFSGEDSNLKSNEFMRKLINKNKSEDCKISRMQSIFHGGKVWYVIVRGENARDMLKGAARYGCKIDVDPVNCL